MSSRAVTVGDVDRGEADDDMYSWREERLYCWRVFHSQLLLAHSGDVLFFQMSSGRVSRKTCSSV